MTTRTLRLRVSLPDDADPLDLADALSALADREDAAGRGWIAVALHDIATAVQGPPAHDDCYPVAGVVP